MQIDFFEEPHSYVVDGQKFPSVTEIIGAVLSKGRFDSVSDEVLERARKRGTLVHEACELLDNGELDWDALDQLDEIRIAENEEPIKPRVLSYQRWRDESGFVVMESEKRVAHKGLRFAGTLDKKGMLYNKLTIVDLKSGLVGPETALQTAGYAIADDCVTAVRIGLQLVPGKIAVPTVFDDPFDIPMFKSFVGAFYWMKNNGY